MFNSTSAEENSSRSRKRAVKTDEPIDPVLPEKKRARRRLLGALALVLAAIIGLPMLLDSEPRQLADDIAIDIPSKDKSGASASKAATVPAAASLDKQEEVIVVPPAAATGAAVAAATVAPVIAAAALKPDPKADAKVEAKALIKDDAALPRAGLAAEPKATDKKADAKSEAKPEIKAEAKREQALESAKLSNEKPERFVVQVAALGSPEKATELQSRLKAAGIKTYTQKVATQSGQRIRVRAGPFTTKTEAEKTRAKLVKMGLNATLVPA